MADKKISALTAASTPLAGTEVLPIVQSGATVKVAVSDLTAGRAISATQLTLTTGNLIVSSGKGIDFSATPGTGTSELLADYEEGTFTVASDSAQVVLNSNTCLYTKIGRQVTCTGSISVASIGSPTGNLGFDGLPFTIANADGANVSVSTYSYGWAATMTTTVMGAASKNAPSWYLQKTNALGSVAVLSGDVQAGTVIWFCISYMTP
jgi:hypothetical protein